MKNQRTLDLKRGMMRIFLLVALCLVIGCEDDSKPATDRPMDAEIETVDAVVSGDDLFVPDMDVRLDVTVDAEVLPDQMVDAYVQLERDIGPYLVQETECVAADDCGQFQRCAGGICQIDLRPDVFRVNDITVIEPKLSAGPLQGILMAGVTSGALTLLVEPGKYDDTGYARWYMGNGNGVEPYRYLHQFPIQTFRGSWRCVDTNTNGTCEDGENPFWHIEDYSPFELIVPTSRNAEGAQCYTRMTTQVELRVKPVINEDTTLQIEAELSGYLLARDAAAVTFVIGNLEYQLERDFLKPEDFTVNALCNVDGVPLTCSDTEPSCPNLLVPEVVEGCFTGQCVTWAECCPGGIPGCDATPDGYLFNFRSTAIPISFADDPPNPDGSNRDPNPIFENPIGCE